MKYFYLLEHKFVGKNILLFNIILPSVASEICLRLLSNERETSIIQNKPGRIWHWNAIAEKFEHLEALTLNNTALCSVNVVNDLRGKTLVVATDIIYPYVIINANNNEVTGLIGDAWRILETALKFKTVYRSTRQQSPDATLMNGHTHALLMATSMYSYTSSYYTYSTSLTTSSYALFVQSNDAISTPWRYINIFSRDFWIASFIMIACIACTNMGIYRFKKFMCINYKDCDDELVSPSFNFLCILGSICGQGFHKMPRSLSLQIIVLFSLMMGMLLTCGFSSTLISCLARKESVIPLANLEDVATKRTHSLCVRNESNAYLHFTNGSIIGSIQKEWEGLINVDCPDMTDSTIFLSKICRPNLAYLELPEIFLPQYNKIKNNCNIVQLPDNYWRLKLSFMHARTAQHRQVIDSYIMRMRSAGILNYLEKKWVLKESQFNYLQTSSFQPVRYMHIYMSTLLFLLMAVLSIFVCVLENIWYKLKFKKKHSNLTSQQTCNSKLNIIRMCYKMRATFKWRQKLNLMFLSGNIKNSELLQNVTLSAYLSAFWKISGIS